VPRLLVCRTCKTIDVLPLYDGPKELEAQDPVLDSLVRRHVQLHGDTGPETAALLVASEDPCRCDEKKTFDLTGRVIGKNPLSIRGSHTFWEGHKDDVLKGLRERWTGFDPEFYATKDTFTEDAMRCFNLHRRPQGTCIDWHADYRRVTPHDWKGRNVYLCDFCPVASSVKTAQRLALGAYNREPGEID
jgi:hypothetical protein